MTDLPNSSSINSYSPISNMVEFLLFINQMKNEPLSICLLLICAVHWKFMDCTAVRMSCPYEATLPFIFSYALADAALNQQHLCHFPMVSVAIVEAFHCTSSSMLHTKLIPSIKKKKIKFVQNPMLWVNKKNLQFMADSFFFLLWSSSLKRKHSTIEFRIKDFDETSNQKQPNHHINIRKDAFSYCIWMKRDKIKTWMRWHSFCIKLPTERNPHEMIKIKTLIHIDWPSSHIQNNIEMREIAENRKKENEIQQGSFLTWFLYFIRIVWKAIIVSVGSYEHFFLYPEAMRSSNAKEKEH